MINDEIKKYINLNNCQSKNNSNQKNEYQI
jgi:hypothetical protein